jgi:hypothetical protein
MYYKKVNNDNWVSYMYYKEDNSDGWYIRFFQIFLLIALEQYWVRNTHS